MTAGLGSQDRIEEFKEELDDYSGILLESLADRLAEAFAERMHERVRRELWGYAPDEHLDNRQLIKEQYAGIRPAPGYPASPDHTEKQVLWDLLDVEPRTPAWSSPSRWRCGRARRCPGSTSATPSRSTSWSAGSAPDQVADYAERKGWTLAEAERWLSPNLGYDPED